MKTYSVGFEVGGFDETTFSKDLCDILHMSNAKKEISSDEFFDALPEVQVSFPMNHMSKPFRCTAVLSVTARSQRCKSSLKWRRRR